MNIVITLAGHSRRFQSAGYKIPKFLIELDGKIMLEHVLEMFSPEDNFFFVLNHDQIQAAPYLLDLLKSIRPRTHVTIIEPHENGPVHSVMQIADIPKNEDLIISYCDFTVEWNYQQFKREAFGYDMAIPAFSGFQPASFGSTNYAYMQVDEDNHLIELREKQSFTKNRHLEPASVGIYYFKSWDTFFRYGALLERNGYGNLAEGYVSLIANLMVVDKSKVRVTKVNKFICLGTPEDVDDFKYWARYFRQGPKTAQTKLPNATTINMIPMAGRGRRFAEEFFSTRKPFIGVGTTPMLTRACSSLPPAHRWIILPLEEDAQKYPVEKLASRSVSGEISVIPVDSFTSGQAATCLLGMAEVQPQDQLLISSCDYEVHYDSSKWSEITGKNGPDAAIWVVKGAVSNFKDPKAFAYCVTENGSNVVTKIVEKDTISEDPSSDPLVVGVFWFRRAEDFRNIAEAAIKQNITINGEHYVANSMNLMIQNGFRVEVFWIEQWISFGDPFELELFNYWEEYFHSR